MPSSLKVFQPTGHNQLDVGLVDAEFVFRLASVQGYRMGKRVVSDRLDNLSDEPRAFELIAHQVQLTRI